MELITNYGERTTHLLALEIRDDRNEWAEFYVRTGVSAYSDGKPRHWASWVARSSYGIFGHYWEGMGSTFDKFIAGCEYGYVLSKISEQVFSEKKTRRALCRLITLSRSTKQEKQAAWRRVKELCDEYEGDVLCKSLYEDPVINKCRFDWCDMESREPDPSAVHFMKRLWPRFVAEVGKRMAAPAVAPEPDMTPV